METRLAELHSIFFMQNQSVKRSLPFDSVQMGRQATVQGPQTSLPWHASNRLLESICATDDHKQMQRHRLCGSQSIDAKDLYYNRIQVPPSGNEQGPNELHRRPLEIVPPAGPFERSGSFFPELYIQSEPLTGPRIYSFTAREVRSTPHYRTNHYQMSLQISPRKYRELSLTVTFTQASAYWRLFQISPSVACYWPRTTLPHVLQSQIENTLPEIIDMDDDSHIRLDYSLEGLRLLPWQLPRNQMCFPEASYGSFSHEALLSILDDMQCPKRFEHDLVRMCALRGPQWFLTVLDGQLLYESRNASSPVYTALNLYNIQLLHCLKAAPGIAKLAAIVVDPTTKCFQGYLREIPAEGNMYRMMWRARAEGNLYLGQDVKNGRSK